MSKTKQELLFIYNAKSGFLSGLADLVHKGVSPQTYPCKLCQLTYRGASMDETWQAYVDTLGIPATFLHKNEFATAYPNERYDLPAILLRTDANILPLISAQDFKSISSLTELVSRLDKALSNSVHTAYQCPECGLHYTDEKTAKECETWCAEHKSCNLAITKHSRESSMLSKKQ